MTNFTANPDNLPRYKNDFYLADLVKAGDSISHNGQRFTIQKVDHEQYDLNFRRQVAIYIDNGNAAPLLYGPTAYIPVIPCL